MTVIFKATIELENKKEANILREKLLNDYYNVQIQITSSRPK